MTTWADVENLIKTTSPKNVYKVGESLRGNDGLILTQNPHIAAGYVKTDWNAIECRAGR